jgi:hypothetical protein
MRLAPASPRFPYSRQTAYHYFRAWRIDGTWRCIHSTLRERTPLREGRQASPSAAIIDSQSVRTTEKGGREDTTEPKEGKRAQTPPFSGHRRAGDVKAKVHPRLTPC